MLESTLWNGQFSVVWLFKLLTDEQGKCVSRAVFSTGVVIELGSLVRYNQDLRGTKAMKNLNFRRSHWLARVMWPWMTASDWLLEISERQPFLNPRYRHVAALPRLLQCFYSDLENILALSSQSEPWDVTEKYWNCSEKHQKQTRNDIIVLQSCLAVIFCIQR